jgi:hypothetical protein
METKSWNLTLYPMLWIRDILVRDPDPRIHSTGFRIRIFFRQWLKRYQQNIVFFKVFWLLLFEGTFTSAFIDKKSKGWKDPDPGGPKT